MADVAEFNAEPVARVNISEEVADRIRGSILRGEISPGEKLPSERVLAQKFGTNRNTLREALRMLEAQGLISIRQGLSAEVLDFRDTANLSLLPHYLEQAGDTPEVFGLVRDLYRIRMDFNVQVARQAAEVVSAEGREDLLGLLAELKRCRKDAGAVMDLDIRIYRVLVRETGSLVNMWAFNSFVPLHRFVTSKAPEGWTHPDFYFEKIEKVVRAVVAGRAKAAERSMRDLLVRMDELMFDLLDEFERNIRESK